MTFLPVEDLTEAQLVRTRAIYEENFPPALRSDFDSLAQDDALAYLDRHRVVGFVVLRRMPSTGWVFLRYFVVGEHGRGTGSRMWTDLCAWYADAARIVLDVEHPGEPGIDADEEHERRRRIEFYGRLGVDVLPVRDYLPPQEGGPQPMLLLTRRTSSAPDDLDDDGVRAVVVATYADRYGLDEDDPVVRQTLRISGLSVGP